MTALALSVGDDEQPVHPLPVTPDLLATVAKQVEFYFSDNNLATDVKLQKLVRKGPEGLVPVKLFVNFRKVRALTKDVAVITEALRSSTLLQLSDDLKQVRRVARVPQWNVADLQRRTIIVEHLPPLPTIESVTRMFEAYGAVSLVRINSKETTNKGKLPGWLTAATHSLHQQYAFVEFVDPDSAILAVAALHEVDEWGSKVHARHLLFAPSDKNGNVASMLQTRSSGPLASRDISPPRRSSGGGASSGAWTPTRSSPPTATAFAAAATLAFLRRSLDVAPGTARSLSAHPMDDRGVRSPRPLSPARSTDPSATGTLAPACTAAAALLKSRSAPRSSAAAAACLSSLSAGDGAELAALGGLSVRTSASFPRTSAAAAAAAALDGSHACCWVQPLSGSSSLRSADSGSLKWHPSPAPAAHGEPSRPARDQACATPSPQSAASCASWSSAGAPAVTPFAAHASAAVSAALWGLEEQLESPLGHAGREPATPLGVSSPSRPPLAPSSSGREGAAAALALQHALALQAIGSADLAAIASVRAARRFFSEGGAQSARSAGSPGSSRGSSHTGDADPAGSPLVRRSPQSGGGGGGAGLTTAHSASAAWGSSSPRQQDARAAACGSPRRSDGAPGQPQQQQRRGGAAVRGKKDYAAWAAATPEYRAEAKGPVSAPRASAEVASAPVAEPHAHQVHTARGPDGSRGFGGLRRSIAV